MKGVWTEIITWRAVHSINGTLQLDCGTVAVMLGSTGLYDSFLRFKLYSNGCFNLKSLLYFYFSNPSPRRP